MSSGKLREYYVIATWSFLGLAALYAILLSIYVAWDLPLWLDESWTAVLSSAPTFRSFVGQMWLDSNAPLYYFLMWLWPFESTTWLRIPSIAFMIAASAIPIVWKMPDISRQQACAWTAVLLLWFSATGLFVDARYYALLFALATAQCVAFVRLDHDPTLRRAMVWTGLATLCILTHYFAAVFALAQGVFYLARHRAAAIRTWPALILTAPAFAWTLYHWPRLKLYAAPEFSWYGKSSLGSALDACLFVFGDMTVALGLALVLLVFARRERPSAQWVAVFIPALGATLAMALAGTQLAMFEPRYLLAMAPAALLGVVLLLRPSGYLPMAFWMFANIGAPMEWKHGLTMRSNFGLEQPVREVLDAKTVTWMIDYPGSKVHVPWQMENMLKDAFARNGRVLAKARWGKDFEAGDALILIRRELFPQTVGTPAGWPCKTLRSNWGFHVAIVCRKPQNWRARQDSNLRPQA